MSGIIYLPARQNQKGYITDERELDRLLAEIFRLNNLRLVNVEVKQPYDIGSFDEPQLIVTYEPTYTTEGGSMSWNINTVIEPGAFAPSRAHKNDAAIDLCSKHDGVVKPHSYAYFDTGVHIKIPNGNCGLIVSRSGLNKNYGITSTGLIDPGYTGSIGVVLHNDGDDPFEVHAGDRISQLVFFECKMFGLELASMDGVDESDRGSDGWGSTGL